MTDLPPRRKPYLIMAPEDRIGTTYVPVDSEKVIAIVESDYPDQTQDNAPADESSQQIAANLIEFLKHEVNHGRLPENLLPLQSGIGNIANAVVSGLSVRSNPYPSSLSPAITNSKPDRRRQLQEPQSVD
jgi:acetyl-CoA hydrolase